MKAKRIACILLSVLLLGQTLAGVSAQAAEEKKLSFRRDGSFTILNFSDFQDDDELDYLTGQFIRRAVKKVKPDLIVLTGDNIAGYNTVTAERSFAAIRQFMDIFETLGVPVAMVFGNHDDQGTEATREMQLAVYTEYGVNLARDENDLYGCATYNLPIYSSSQPDVVKFNLFMIDSGSNDLVRGGYDYVHPDQLAWVRETSARLAQENGGPVNSIVFQHIIVREIFDALEVTTQDLAQAECGGVYYKLPATAAPGSILGESPCPGTYNGGEFQTLKEIGGVLAVVSGHDHKNAFVVPYQGVDLVNTPTCGFGSYGAEESRGARVIRLQENNTAAYETQLLSLKELMRQAPLTMLRYRLMNLLKQIREFFSRFGYKQKTE